MKRILSDCSEGDVFYEDSSVKEEGSPSQSCHRSSDRKRRRGFIEKRRRDRINCSLTELKRLVPAAFEKQDSAKLEKAEILQMTVDHLKTLNSKGVGGYGGQDNLAMDYRAAGFRECAAEVVRYLDSVEGLDTQNPLRLRIVSHLSRFIGQKEFFPNPAGSAGATWNHGTPNVGGIGPHQVEQLAMAAAAAAASHNSYSLHDHQHNGRTMGGGGGGGGGGGYQGDGHNHHGNNLVPASAIRQFQGSSSNAIDSRMSTSGSNNRQMAPLPINLPGLASVHTQFFGSVPVLSPNSICYNNNQMSALTSLSQNVKPYRPWGAELVY